MGKKHTKEAAGGMLAEAEEKNSFFVGPDLIAGTQRSFIAAHYLPIATLGKVQQSDEPQIVGWLGAVDGEYWRMLEEFAPTPRQRQQVLRATLEALTIRYAGLLEADGLRMRFAELLEDVEAQARWQTQIAEGASFRLCVEEAASLETAEVGEANLNLIYLTGHSHCGWRFRAGSWTAKSIERFHEQFWRLLGSALQRPDSAIGELDYLPESEFQLLTQHLCGSVNYECDDHSTVSRFEKIAKQYPARTAVVCGNRQIAYAELNEAANRLAHYLMYFSVRPSSVVAICLPPSVEAVIAKLAVQKLGAVSLMLNSNAPTEEHGRILQNCGNPLCISNASLTGGNTLNLDAEAAAIRSQSKLNPSVHIRAEHAAEMVMAYDGGGSSPQTTLYLHRSLLSVARGNTLLRTTSEDVIVQCARVDSAQASLECWTALLNGAKLVLPIVEFGDDTRGLAAFLRKYKATQLYLPEGKIIDWLQHGMETLLGVDTLLVYGPDEQRAALMELSRLRRKGRLLHSYGNGGMGLLGLLRQITTSVPEETLAIPVEGSAAYVLDVSGAPVAIGAIGELCLEGPGLAWGYLNDSGSERSVFASKDFGRGEGGRLYRTGDLVRWNEYGRIERVSRLEQRVCFEGNVVDLYAIERELRKAPQVLDCAVVVRQVAGHLKRLIAYVQLREPVVNLRRVLREELAKSLPPEMLPNEFVPMSTLPLHRDGQLDREALSAPALGPEVSDAEADARAAEKGTLRRCTGPASRPGLWGLWKQALRKIV